MLSQNIARLKTRWIDSRAPSNWIYGSFKASNQRCPPHSHWWEQEVSGFVQNTTGNRYEFAERHHQTESCFRVSDQLEFFHIKTVRHLIRKTIMFRGLGGCRTKSRSGNLEELKVGHYRSGSTVVLKSVRKWNTFFVNMMFLVVFRIHDHSGNLRKGVTRLNLVQHCIFSKSSTPKLCAISFEKPPCLVVCVENAFAKHLEAEF